MSDDQTPQEEAADWGEWLDRFDRHIWPVFRNRGYSKDTAALIYFTKLPGSADVEDEDEDDERFG